MCSYLMPDGPGALLFFFFFKVSLISSLVKMNLFMESSLLNSGESISGTLSSVGCSLGGGSSSLKMSS